MDEWMDGRSWGLGLGFAELALGEDEMGIDRFFGAAFRGRMTFRFA